MNWFFSLMICAILTGGLPEKNSAEKEININLWKRTLQVKENGAVIKSYRIAVGARDTPSPVGIFTIVDKRKNWFDGFGSRWMQLSVPWGTFGIHGTNKPYSIGGYASEGCFRMFDHQVDELYDLVRIGTKVTIDGPLTGHPEVTYWVLVKGSRGASVRMVQNYLKAEGLYQGEVNGQFDRLTEDAVILHQKKNGLPVTAQINYTDLLEMGIIE